MKKTKIEYDLASVPYFYYYGEEDDKELSDRIGYKSHQFLNKSHGLMSFVLEAYAAHLHDLVELMKESFADCPKKTVWPAIAEANRHIEHGKKTYLCIKDSVLIDIKGLQRTSRPDVAVLNWYSYVSAREAVVVWLMETAKVGYEEGAMKKARRLMAEYEWKNIKKILNYAHLFDYPRPTAKHRMKHLKRYEIDDVPLLLT